MQRESSDARSQGARLSFIQHIDKYFKAEFEYFEIKRGEWGEEIAERLDTAGKLLHRSVELGERSVELGEESVEIGKKMLEKQDETIGEIRGLREDLKTYMEERFNRIEREIEIIKAKMGMAQDIYRRNHEER